MLKGLYGQQLWNVAPAPSGFMYGTSPFGQSIKAGGERIAQCGREAGVVLPAEFSYFLLTAPKYGKCNVDTAALGCGVWKLGHRS